MSQRKQLDGLPCIPHRKQLDSAEIEQKYHEIMKQTGIPTLNGQRVPNDISDFEAEDWTKIQDVDLIPKQTERFRKKTKSGEQIA